MISKHVSANSFYHTCRYICNKPGSEVLVVEGVRGHNYKLMADDFETQKQLRASKNRACFHSILSFYPGEKPSDELMKEIGKKYLEELGIVDTQYSISKHTDKAHLHLHIVANMVNNKGKAISDSWIGLRGKKAAQNLTAEYKLVPALEKNLKLTNLEALNKFEQNKYKIYIAISENLPRCRSMEELEKQLSKLGIETQYKYKGQTEEKQGVSFKRDHICIKGSEVDRKFSIAGLEKAFEIQRKLKVEEEQKEEQKAIRFDHSSRSNIASWKGLQSNLKRKNGPGLTNSLLKNLNKTMEKLMKPEQGKEPPPFQLLKQEKRYKKKQNRQHPGW